MKMQKIAVLGAGLMGSGIAQVAAQSGYRVGLFDVYEDSLTKSIESINGSLGRLIKAGKLTEEQKAITLERISPTIELTEAVAGAQIVIEAVPEKLELKKEIFQRLDSICAPETILATNTSELSITALAAATKRADKVIGMHWFNPPQLMRLIEVVMGLNTSQATLQQILELSRSMDKETVVVKDSQGFITTRVIAAHMMESFRIYQEGLASAEDIDKAVRLGLNYPMGPLELADYVGLDTLLWAGQGLAEAFGERFKAPQLIQKMVEAGHLGRKTGQGFYQYAKKGS